MPTKHEINRSFLSQLNEPERSEALENYSTLFAELPNHNTANSVASAVMVSFDWSKSRQGHEYWSIINDNLENNNYEFEL
jgi:hypothetical protein